MGPGEGGSIHLLDEGTDCVPTSPPRGEVKGTNQALVWRPPNWQFLNREDLTMEKPLRWKIGDVEIIRIAESTSPFPPEFLMVQATAERIASYASWLKPHFIDDDDNMLIFIQKSF